MCLQSIRNDGFSAQFLSPTSQAVSSLPEKICTTDTVRINYLRREDGIYRNVVRFQGAEILDVNNTLDERGHTISIELSVKNITIVVVTLLVRSVVWKSLKQSYNCIPGCYCLPLHYTILHSFLCYKFAHKIANRFQSRS